MKKYNSPEIEIVESINVVATSSEVESEKIPFTVSGDNYENYQL